MASRRAWGGALALVAVLALTPAAHAYETLGPTWPGKLAKVKYHSELANDGDRWALKRAVSAWNEAGVKVRLRSVSAGDAKVRVRRDSALPCGYGYAPYTYSNGEMQSAGVQLGTCSDSYRYTQANVAAHELGHVLGLDHEDDKCAQMNSTNFYFVGEPESARPIGCPDTPSGKWRCRLLNRDDLKGAKSLYGGDFEVAAEYCDVPGASAARRDSTAAPPAVNDYGDDARGTAVP